MNRLCLRHRLRPGDAAPRPLPLKSRLQGRRILLLPPREDASRKKLSLQVRRWK